MIRADIDIELVLQGPFLTKSSAPGDWGLDQVVARDGSGTPIIPATLITGKLRQSWEEMADLLQVRHESSPLVPAFEDIGDLLGRPRDGKTWDARRKRLQLEDFKLQNPDFTDDIRYRIRLDPERGAVEERAQLMLESPFASGQRLIFAGKGHFLCRDPKEAQTIAEQIETGLQWITQMGALRGIGFGRLVDVTVKAPDVTKSTADLPLDTEAFDLLLKPQSPFCVDASTPSDNTFKSAEVISGATMLGCLARMLETMSDNGRTQQDDYTQLRRHFSRLRVQHAFPARECMKRPVVMPLSLVQAGGKTYDIALAPGPCLIDGEAPRFMVDWKDDGPGEQFGWPRLRRELRVRTAIDSDRLRAEDEKLFSYDLVIPGNVCWLSSVRLDEVPEQDRADVSRQLQSLLSLGLLGLGKTKAVADTTLLPSGKLRPAMAVDRTGTGLGEDRLICLTLQTDALLCSPQNLDETAGAEELTEAYRETWEALTPALSLKRFFVRQRLAGGEYLARRFGREGGGYCPWLLTTAGSVFVFKVTDWPRAKKDLQQWLRRGLPIAGPVKTAYGIQGDPEDHWRYCPYVPANGYGEIAVNLEVHERWRPENTEPVHPVEEVSP